MPRSKTAFEDIPNVSEDANQILRNISLGLEACKKGVTLPKISLNHHTYQGLFNLEERLMSWAGAQQSAKNNGFEVWHAKYLGGCCFLVGCELDPYRKKGYVQTTTRTTRCAVSMINQILKEIHGIWGPSAFAVLPALAMRKYMLAAVARHCEQKRLSTIPEVARNAHIQSVGSPGYDFNPARLLSILTGEEESKIASWLGLPHVPGMRSCSWEDLGLASEQKYVDNQGTALRYNMPQCTGSIPLCGLPSPPSAESLSFTEMPNSMTIPPLSSTSYAFNTALDNMQSIPTMRVGVLGSQIQFPSELISREYSWPSSPQPKSKGVDEESNECTSKGGNLRRQNTLSRQYLSQSTKVPVPIEGQEQQERVLTIENGARRLYTTAGNNKTPSALGSSSNDCYGDEEPVPVSDRPLDSFSENEVIKDSRHSAYL